MPAAAVIPAPIAYINFAEVKKLLVGTIDVTGRGTDFCLVHSSRVSFFVDSGSGVAFTGRPGPAAVPFTLRKLECS